MNDVNGSAVGGQPGAAAGAGQGAGGATGGDQPWFSGIQDEGLRGYVQTKGFKDPAALADSYRNLEKLQGVPQDRLLKLPERSDDPAWGDVHKRLGRPDDAKGYELQFEGDPAFAERFGGAFHKAGLSKDQAKALNAEWNGYVSEMIEADKRDRETRDATEMQELKTKWGGTYEENVEAGRRAGREFGLSEDEFQQISGSLGSGKTLELFQRIGAKLGEAKPFDPSGSGGGSGFGMTPEAARARIQTLAGDKDWTAKYLSGGAAEADEMSRLQVIANGGKP
ncbi:MAG: hypothetical protein KA144_02170 [Xanthomonadaceae bacterium]|nr:hypothetical protein [Xanthomonadaceae bacterium]MBP7622451.1 hypothetical protein [Xanthomonadales bacterium]